MKKFLSHHTVEIYFFLWALFLQGIVFSLTQAFSEQGFLWASDSKSYLQLAENLLKYKIFTLDPAWGPSAFRTPLYPLFIAGLLSFVPKVGFVIAVQSVISAFNVPLFYVMAKRIFSERVAWLAALLFSAEASRLFIGSQLLSETIFLTFFIIATFYIISFLFQNGSWKQLIVGSVCLGLATLDRPITQFLPWFLFLFFIVMGFWRKEYRRFFVGAVVVVAINATVLAPWIIRNKIVFGVPKLSPLGGIQLYLVNLPHFLEYRAKQVGVSHEYYQELLNNAETDLRIQIDYDNWTFDSIRLMEFKYEKYFSSKFFEIVKQYPFSYIFIHLRRSTVFFIDSGASQFYGAMLANASFIPKQMFYPILYWGGRLVWLFILTVTFGGAFFGAWRFKENAWLYTFLILTILYFPVISAMNWMAPRFRLTINHMLFLLFAQSAVYLWNKWKLRQSV